MLRHLRLQRESGHFPQAMVTTVPGCHSRTSASVSGRAAQGGRRIKSTSRVPQGTSTKVNHMSDQKTIRDGSSGSPAGSSDTTTFTGNDKVLFGIIFGVLAFWLFAQTTLNIAPVMAEDLGVETNIMNIAVSITALFSGMFIVVMMVALQEKPGTYCFIGNGDTPMVHHPQFVLNKEILPRGAAYWVALTEGLLQ